ncbi:MAG: helix-turn-helix transcriptional regulator [Clostridiaceae bacterium]|nr:helix-turn-helix transcriptional regulator [Clostridiaceae bacterium]
MIKNFRIVKATTPLSLESEMVHWLTHSHTEYELNLYINVKATIFINETGYFINDNDILFIPANVEHSIYLSNKPKNTQYSRIVINFNNNFIKWMSQVLPIWSYIDTLREKSSYKISLKFEDYLYVSDLFNKILENYQLQNSSDMVINFYYLIKYLANSKNHVNHDSKVYEISRYLDENYKEDITLQKLSELFYLNPSYISRLFRKRTGLTIVQYLQFKRILDAHNAITYKGTDIATACYESGFGVFSTFTESTKD